MAFVLSGDRTNVSINGSEHEKYDPVTSGEVRLCQSTAAHHENATLPR